MKMKKLLTFFLAFSLLITTFTGCGAAKEDGAQSDLQVAFATRYETPVTTWDPSIQTGENRGLPPEARRPVRHAERL